MVLGGLEWAALMGFASLSSCPSCKSFPPATWYFMEAYDTMRSDAVLSLGGGEKSTE